MANDDANKHGGEQQWVEASVDDCWANIVRIYHDACTTTLGFKQKTNKEWLSDNTWNAINERKKVKCKLLEAKSPRIQAQYSILNVQVKRSAQADKRRFIENLATEAEAAARWKEQGTVFKITRQICGRRSGTQTPICDKNGILLTAEKPQEKRWAEHFQEDPPGNLAGFQDAAEDLDICTDPPTKQEVLQAIKSLKNGKAPGADLLNVELFKCDPELAAEILLPFYCKVWNGDAIPGDWSKGIIIPIPKKGALTDCNNWRGISLLSLPSKSSAEWL